MAKFMPEEFAEKTKGKGKIPPQFLKHSKRMKHGKMKGRARMQAKALSSQAAEENEVNEG